MTITLGRYCLCHIYLCLRHTHHMCSDRRCWKEWQNCWWFHLQQKFWHQKHILLLQWRETEILIKKSVWGGQETWHLIDGSKGVLVLLICVQILVRFGCFSHSITLWKPAWWKTAKIHRNEHTHGHYSFHFIQSLYKMAKITGWKLHLWALHSYLWHPGSDTDDPSELRLHPPYTLLE